MYTCCDFVPIHYGTLIAIRTLHPNRTNLLVVFVSRNIAGNEGQIFKVLGEDVHVFSLRDVTVTDNGGETVWKPSTVNITVGSKVNWSWSGFHNVAETDNSAATSWNGVGFRSGSATQGGTYLLENCRNT